MDYNDDGSIDYETEDAGDCGMAPEPDDDITKHICKESTARDDTIRDLRAEVERLTAEINEGDYWQERAKDSFANGTCPVCFCTDEGPHESGCYHAELETRAIRAEAELAGERNRNGSLTRAAS
jgi:hypothetical protein